MYTCMYTLLHMYVHNRAMKPKVLVNLMPKILNDVPELQPRNIAALKACIVCVYVCVREPV